MTLFVVSVTLVRDKSQFTPRNLKIIVVARKHRIAGNDHLRWYDMRRVDEHNVITKYGNFPNDENMSRVLH